MIVTWNAAAGPSIAMVFARDTRRNADTTYDSIRIVSRDTVAPAVPKMLLMR